MDILTKPITAFQFNDIVEFCQNGHPEGIQIDYKKEYSAKGLEKHFAALSNTRGGVIIIGVEEDKKIGKPISWEGIEDKAQLIERAYQESCNITPIPSIKIHKTNPDKKGKVFILIRVLEGNKTPYYVQNDSNIWIRTGNISNPIDISSPEWTELLVGKQEKALRARSNYLLLADDVYKLALIREEKRRLNLIAEAKRKEDGSERNYYQKQLGEGVSMCIITIQPYFPREAFAKPKEIIDKKHEFAYRDGLPGDNQEPIPEGTLNFQHNYTGYIECQQFYSKGLIYNNLDILRVDESGKKVIYLSRVASRVFIILRTARNFYNLFGYQGVLKLNISLSELVDIHFRKIVPNGFIDWDDDNEENLLQDYSWEFDLNTIVLNNGEKYKEFFYTLMREIYWNLGYRELSDQLIDQFIKENQLS